ncbi:putative RNA recognition motif domain, nucleotide-binding alpha-beta plait domain superfamily [Helianthus annuus]|nr:putative RNA recognition motif domain, nucleotide-binding alpha-beta plait domain superfamily [Helianthus annuus]KAJ0557394.1 putative RNA recognition motif domain, nucleotide-binding alpha-beta plait domain superfamily [Helianthus annuus]KAJ0728909.1 putative RNA recognition motif domain, nucleotide-binding alpha-beta plait domain superfamily [Helianthus annuus]KAJ0905214.1 putative RNA recognition motif domain, nucleotide-binding alpha-beta plait domain superfamily [Helianthus annuus]
MAYGDGRGYFGKNKFIRSDGWNNVLSKKQVRQEKAFFNREARLRNATSFFLSNLPDSCNRATLWKVFGYLENLEDAFVPFKKDRGGNRFGFLNLFNVQDPASWIEKLKEVRIDGAVINVNLAKFNRDGTKTDTKVAGERVSVFDRLDGGVPVFSGPRYVRSEPKGNMNNSFATGVRSYSAVLKNQQEPGAVQDRMRVDLPLVNTDSKKKLEFKSLVGETKDIDILNNLKDTLEEGLVLRYLGGLKVLITFGSAREAVDFLRLRCEEWEQWFSRLYLWEGLPPVFERVAWIKVLGVPVSLWDRQS